MNKCPKLIKDETQFEPSNTNLDLQLSLAQCLDRRLLISPDTNKELIAVAGTKVLTDGSREYRTIAGSPLLYPTAITEAWRGEGALPLAYCSSALQQYILLSQIKQSGEINAPLDSVPARKHQYRFREFCKGLSGLVLDVGSDRPSHSSQLLPSSCEYLGLDPYAGHGEFRIIGLGEILPIRNQSMDAVLFNTSLDHILDYHTAIEEAHRILKPNGSIAIATYAWLERATLLTDSVHFHHFREFEILGALENDFEILDIRRYEDPKHASHRYGLYVRATSRGSR
jgi:SAM-dependent methyltransferase